MSTPYNEIYELFLASIRDFRIDKKFIESVEDAEDYMKPFLIKGLVNFGKCQKDLEDRDDDKQKFNQTLSTSEKAILANLMVAEWLFHDINDILNLKLHLQDTDFRIYSSAQNLREKSNYLNNIRETVNKQITEYGYNTIDWKTL